VITAIGVVIPARDEGSTVGACLDALGKALCRLPARVEYATCLVADRCSDNTAEQATHAFAGRPRAATWRNERELTIGEVRALGVRRCLSLLEGHDPGTTLILSTDADSRVDLAWAREHLRRAEEGNHAIAGTAELLDPSGLGPLTRCRYQAVLDDPVRPGGHGNVYGANLGVRADAYTAVGGFSPLSTGEDHDLWRRLGRAGFRRCYDENARVLTSSRLAGRAPHGLAALLRDLSPS
jgi:hypothetical protein